MLRSTPWMLGMLALVACDPTGDSTDPTDTDTSDTDTTAYVADHGPYSEAATGPLGSIVDWATEEQRATFERGLDVMQHRFSREEGVGPAFNITFCGSCHEKPVFGGSAGMYRNFFLSQVRLEDGAQFPGLSAGSAGGVVRIYQYDIDDGPIEARPPVPEESNVIGQRNPIPFFGTGVLAELEEEVILAHADPDDADGDGISGRPNYDRGFVGRFGVKAQTVSIEGFIRGPLFNHGGITTSPLSQEQKAALPVDSSSTDGMTAWLSQGLMAYGQAAADDGPNFDDDYAEDPEMSTDMLFDLVSFSMLLAGPAPEPLNDQTRRGLQHFDESGCGSCHIPRLDGPRGPVPVYSDLLLHDMGPDLADGLIFGEATGDEFRTQPLWGVSAVGPYLHDGRATTLEEAILWHGGEATKARDAYKQLDPDERDDLVEFLLSLGSRDQATGGLRTPDHVLPDVGEWGGPVEALDKEGWAEFEAGFKLFDHEFGFADGLGGPRFNGDSCRACHFEPVFGGAGPRGVNVIRHGILNEDDEYVPPSVGTILHRVTALHDDHVNRPQAQANLFTARQTPHLFGLGLIDELPDSVFLDAADPYDEDGDGISGRVAYVDGGRIGRFGWQAQVPSIDEFIRDAVTAELGMTIEQQAGLTYGRVHDNDDVADPEFRIEDAHLLSDYLRMLGPPPRAEGWDSAEAEHGELVFSEVGCASCHTPSIAGPRGDVNLYSDLLLHEILPPDQPGIEEFGANMWEMRTPPLWGVAKTGPYLHDGRADTLEQAVLGHFGEATGVVEAFEALSPEDRADLLTFVGTL